MLWLYGSRCQVSENFVEIQIFLLLFDSYLGDSLEWRIDPKDLRSNYNVLNAVKCHNCRENGHRMAFCPQPKKQVICFTCGVAGHREVRCPNAICLKVNSVDD